MNNLQARIMLSALVLLWAVLSSSSSTQIRAQQPPKVERPPERRAKPGMDAPELLKKGKLPGLLKAMKHNPEIRFPAIYTWYYCQRQKKSQSAQCRGGNAFGLQLYRELRIYQEKKNNLPWPQYKESIIQLATLRDQVSKKGKLGNIMLADLIDRLIYWRIIYRATRGTAIEVRQLDKLRMHFKDVLADWKSVARAVEEEYSIKLDYKKIVDRKITREEDYFLFSGGSVPVPAARQTRALYYLRMAMQLDARGKLHQKKPEAEAGVPIQTIPEMLSKDPPGDFFRKQVAGNCIFSSRVEMLKYYLLLMIRCRTSNQLSALKINKRNSDVGFQVIKQLDAAVPVLLPDVVGKRLICEQKVSARNFYDIANGVKLLDETYKSPIETGDEGFDLTFA